MEVCRCEELGDFWRKVLALKKIIKNRINICKIRKVNQEENLDFLYQDLNGTSELAENAKFKEKILAIILKNLVFPSN